MFNTPSFVQPQQQQLPYNPQGPQWNALAVNINNLPVNLSVLQNQVHPNLVNYLPGIAVGAIDAIQSRAGTNALRMFLFNQLADGNYNNAGFISLIKTVCDIAEYYAASGGVQIEQAITQAIDWSIQFAAFANLRTFPALQSYVDQNMFSNLQALEQKQNQLAQQVQGYQQQKQMRNQGFTQQTTFNQPATFGAAQTQTSSWNNQSTGMFTTAPQAQDTGTAKMMNSWDTAPGAQSWRTPEPKANTFPVLQPVQPLQPAFKFNTPEPAAPVQPPTPQYPKTYMHDGRTMVKQKDPGVVWRPSERWPVDVSDSYTADVYYVLHEDGSMEPIIKKLTKEEKAEKMKTINTNAGHKDKAWDRLLKSGHAERLASLEARGQIKITRSEDVKRQDKIINEGDVVQDNDYLIISGQEQAFSQTDLALAATDTPEKPCEGYSKPTIRVTPIASTTDVEGLVKALRDSVSLEQCAGKLTVEGCEIPLLEDRHEARSRMIVYGKLNRILTASVNHYLKYKLGLPGLSIDSFDEDATDLLKYVQTNYPANYGVALKRDQRWIITSVLSTTKDGEFTGEFDDSVREHFLPENYPPDKTPTFLGVEEVHLSINEFSTELMLGLDSPTDVLSVYKDAQPLMYSLCSLLVHSDHVDVYAYYIKTLDDVVYVMHRSAINDGVYLIGIQG